MIDLHSHTTASDGQHAPSELVRQAHEAGVRTLAVTDHDTLAGLPEARAAAERLGVDIVNGIELSAFLNGREVHVLGHFLRADDPVLGKLSLELRDERRTRMEQMVAKLVAMGVPVTMAEVERFAGADEKKKNLGRPHLARALVERGWVKDVREAFDRFLADGKPAFVDRDKLPAENAIALIHGAAGTATLAHPGVSKVEPHELVVLARAGLDGLEVLHSDHNPSVREKFARAAAELSLIATAGSDFHGEAVAPNRKLGSADMPRESFEALRARATAAAANPDSAP